MYRQHRSLDKCIANLKATGTLAAFRVFWLTGVVAVLSGCAGGSGNPRIQSIYVGQPSANFFLKYGPPDQVIALKGTTIGTNPATAREVDPKELVYYWSSVNKQTATKTTLLTTGACTLAILTKADGSILRIEAQAENGDIESARKVCETIID